MAINTLDGALAGMQYPREIVKALTGTLVIGRPHSLLMTAGIPGAATLGDDATKIPNNWAVVSSSVANPTTITVTNHPWANNDVISISGHTGSTPALDGVYTITKTGASTFTIPVNVTVGGTGGVACGRTSAGGAGLTGYTLTSLPGQIPFTNPVSGNTYLARLQGQATQAGTLMLCDRLWHNGGISPTKITEQVFTSSVQIPARDATGTNTGNGVFGAIEVVSATGAGTPTLTLKYTNSGGATGHIATNVIATVASSIAGTFYPIGLQAGDVGIQKAESITLSATWTLTTAVISVVLYRVLARLELTGAQTPNAIDALTSGFARLYDDSVPFIVFIPNAVTSSNISGHVIWTQG